MGDGDGAVGVSVAVLVTIGDVQKRYDIIWSRGVYGIRPFVETDMLFEGVAGVVPQGEAALLKGLRRRVMGGDRECRGEVADAPAFLWVAQKNPAEMLKIIWSHCGHEQQPAAVFGVFGQAVGSGVGKIAGPVAGEVDHGGVAHEPGGFGNGVVRRPGGGVPGIEGQAQLFQGGGVAGAAVGKGGVGAAAVIIDQQDLVHGRIDDPAPEWQMGFVVFALQPDVALQVAGGHSGGRGIQGDGQAGRGAGFETQAGGREADPGQFRGAGQWVEDRDGIALLFFADIGDGDGQLPAFTSAGAAETERGGLADDAGIGRPGQVEAAGAHVQGQGRALCEGVQALKFRGCHQG